jgi:hypothetical protein
MLTNKYKPAIVVCRFVPVSPVALSFSPARLVFRSHLFSLSYAFSVACELFTHLSPRKSRATKAASRVYIRFGEQRWAHLRSSQSRFLTRRSPLLPKPSLLRLLPFRLSTVDSQLSRNSFVCRSNAYRVSKSFICRSYAFAWGVGGTSPIFLSTFRRSDLCTYRPLSFSPKQEEIGDNAISGSHGRGEGGVVMKRLGGLRG